VGKQHEVGPSKERTLALVHRSSFIVSRNGFQFFQPSTGQQTNTRWTLLYGTESTLQVVSRYAGGYRKDRSGSPSNFLPVVYRYCTADFTSSFYYYYCFSLFQVVYQVLYLPSPHQSTRPRSLRGNDDDYSVGTLSTTAKCNVNLPTT
jgi:hypothetical protein